MSLRLVLRFLFFLALLCVPAPLLAQAEDDRAEALRTLITVLDDPAARAALISELERALETAAEPAPSEPDGESPEAEPEPAPAAPVPSEELRSIGGQIADFTREAVDEAVASINVLWRQLANAPRLFGALGPGEIDALLAILFDLSALIAISYGGFLLLRASARAPRAWIDMVFATGGWVAKPVAVGLGLALDCALVALPWAVGYAVAVGVLGVPGEISFAHSLYLNAFLITEIGMAVIRTVVSPAREDRRMVALGTKQARLVMIWSRLFLGLFVYGQMLILPLFNRTISFAAGRAISVLLLLALLALAALAVILARKAVARMLLRLFQKGGTRRLMRGLIVHWHIPALIYLLVLAVAVLTRSPNAFKTLMLANGQIALVVLLGVIASNVLTRMIGRGVHLPANFNARVPLLERQLNALVPVTLTVLRFFVLAAVVIFCLHMLGIIDFAAFLEGQVGARMSGALITVALMVLAAFAVWLALNSWVDYRINPEFAKSVTARERTLLVLLRNAATIAIVMVTLMTVLSELGINIAPLLASAGVIGLAIGFGAQRLVQDIITGIFIQFEGAIDVGDVVSVAGISGVVERLTIRSVSLRDSEGSYHVIPFSTVAAVTNFMRGFSYAVIDVTLPYREDTETVRAAMFAAFEQLRKDPDQGRYVFAPLEWNGVNSFSLTEIVLRARIKTRPGRQWGVRRAYNALVKKAFLAQGIGLPDGEKPKIADTPPAAEPQTPAQSPDSEIALPDPDAGPDSSRET